VSYIFTERFGPKDLLETGNPNKVIKGSEVDEEFRKISEHLQQTNIFASVKYNGTVVKYGYNVKDVIKLAPSAYKIDFINDINTDGSLSAGDYAAVITPYTTNGVPVIGFISDQRESYCEVQFRSLLDGSWEGAQPENQGFAFILIDQVPDIG
jgi:hypothetical protein